MSQRTVVRIASPLFALAFLLSCSTSDSTGGNPTGSETQRLVLTLSPKRDTLLLGTSKAFTATVRTTAGLPQAATVEWVSLEPSVATVTQGTVTAVGLGSTAIVARVGLAADTAIVTVPDVVLSLQLTPSAVLASLGDTLKFEASLTVPDGTPVPNQVVRWTLSDNASATLIRDGLVETLAPGDVTILASSGPYSAEATVRVAEPNLASITISPTAASTYVGSTVQLIATLRDDRGKGVNGRDIVWSSSNTNVVTVNSDGLARGVSLGGAVVTARSSGRSASATVNVASQPANAILITLKPDTIGVGQTEQAVAMPTDASGNPIIGKVIAWQSSNPAVATVNASGLVTAIAGGSTTISAICDAKIASQRLYVRSPIATSISVSPDPAKVTVGGRAHLTADVRDQSGNTMTGQTVSWTSLTPSVATVSTSGDVTAVSLGTAQVRAASATLTGTATIQVQTVPVASVAISPSSLALQEGASAPLSATVLDSAGSTLGNRPVAWSSSNSLVATVSTSGVVTAVAAGVASIMATAEGKFASASVTVAAPPPAAVASITVALNSPTLSVGQSTQAVAQLYDAQGAVLTKRLVTWSSANPTLATVNASGSVTAVSGGSVAIVAQSEGVTGGATLVIGGSVAAAVASVTLSVPTQNLTVGQSVPSVVTLKDAQGNILTGRTISYSTGNSSIVTVQASGVITGVGVGNTTVRATSEGVSATVAVSVTTPVDPVASVVLTASGTSLAIGQIMPVLATLTNGHGTVLTGRTITWSSSAPNVATVSTSGVVTGVAGGSAMISAVSEGVTGSLAFTVNAPGGVNTVTVTLSSPAVSVGQTTQAIAVAKDGSGAPMSGTPTWASSNGAVATVSSTGLVAAVGSGSATITATVAGTQGSASLGVTAPSGTSPNVAPAELPRSVPSFSIPAATRTYTVVTDLQSALDTAKAGDEIRLSGTFSGNFVIPTKACGTWITIRSVAEPPAAGVRVTPSTATGFAKIVSPNNAPALKTANPTCGWRLLGIEITGSLPMTSIQYGLVWLGDGGWVDGGETQTSLAKVPQNFVMDRVYLHGSSTLNSMRCLALNTGATVIRDSWFSECHASGFDSQAIVGWNGPGPYLIENNRLEGAGENVMFGGADPGISGVVPSDITIRGNHVIKPLSWKGGSWSIKNLFELKSAARLLVEGNVFENNWPAAQEGVAIVLKSNANGCQCTFEGTRDITFRYNIVRNAPVGLGLHAADNSYGWTGFVHTQRVRVEHNLFTEIGAEGRASLMLLTQDLADVAIVHNTFVHAATARGLVATMAYADGAARRFAIDDNVLTATATYALYYDGGTVHSAALTAMVGDVSWEFSRNVVGGMDPQYLTLNPSASWYPSTVAGIGLAADYSLASTSPYKGRGLGGTDPGADILEVRRRTAGAIVP